MHRSNTLDELGRILTGLLLSLEYFSTFSKFVVFKKFRVSNRRIKTRVQNAGKDVSALLNDFGRNISVLTYFRNI